jgi:hypothetical protein
MEHERSAPILAHTSLASAPPRQALARLLVGAPVVGIVAVDETDELSTKRGEVGPGMPPLLVGRSRPRLRAGRWWTNARRPCVARRWLTSFEKEAHSPAGHQTPRPPHTGSTAAPPIACREPIKCVRGGGEARTAAEAVVSGGRGEGGSSRHGDIKHETHWQRGRWRRVG